MKTETIKDKYDEFNELLNTADGNADSDVGRFMIWCDDNRQFLAEALAFRAKALKILRQADGLMHENFCALPAVRELIKEASK